MAKTYYLSNTNSDLTGGIFNKVLATTTETSSTITMSPTAASYTTGYAYTASGEPTTNNGTLDGNFSVEINVTTANSNISLSSAINIVDSGSTRFLGDFVTEQSAGTTGVKTFSINKPFAPLLSTWTSRTSGTTNTIRRASWNGSIFVAVGSVGTILTSSDGITWTSRTSGTTDSLEDMTWNGSIFVAVGGQTTPTSVILTSSDGITWTSRTSSSGIGWNSIGWNGSLFVIGGSGGGLATSSDGITWTNRTSGTTGGITGIFWDGSKWISYGAAGWSTSSDGISWSSWSTIGGSVVQPLGMAWNGSIYVYVTSAGAIYTSPDLSTWSLRVSNTTNTLRNVSWSNNRFIAPGNSGTLLTSPDGITWTLRATTQSTNNIYDVIENNNYTVIVGASGLIETATRRSGFLPSDRFFVGYFARNSAMNSQSAVIQTGTTNTEVVTPFYPTSNSSMFSVF